MATTKRQPTWLEVAVRRAGIRKGVRAMTWAFTWAAVRESLGHDPNVEEVADWWNEPVRNAYRDQAAFRACFPMLHTPAPMYENEQARAAIQTLARTADELEQAIREKHARVDRAVLTIGMHTATIT